MYKIDILNCPFGTRCAPPTLLELISPAVEFFHQISVSLCSFVGAVVYLLAEGVVTMIQFTAANVVYVAVALGIYVIILLQSVSAS
jgi:hypothetical protein